MKVLLINPPRYEEIPVIREERCEITERYSVLEPYSMLQIGALLRSGGHDVSLIDANGLDQTYGEVANKVNEVRPDMVIFRFTPTTFDHDIKTAEIVKDMAPNAKVAGICWTLGIFPQRVMEETPFMDIFIKHEYEVVAPLLVDTLSGGGKLKDVPGIAYREGKKVVDTGNATPIEDYDSLPLPAYDLLGDLRPYYINTPLKDTFTILYTSKGCPFKCTYCTVAGTKWKPRSAKSVRAELQHLKDNYGVRFVSFFDETFTVNRERVIDICKATKDLGITWYCNTRVNLVDEEMLKIMYDSGCRGMSYGVESGSQSVLDLACKGVKVSAAEDAIKWAKKAGIKTLCSFIIGLPGETKETIEETRKFVKRTRPTGAQFNVLVPYPGTQIYNDLLASGKIEKIDWRQLYQHQSMVGTGELSPADLDHARIRAYRALYFNPLWLLQNLWYVIRHPSDLKMAYHFVKKILSNFFVHRMKHAH